MSKSCFARSVLARLSGLSHRWLGAGPGAQLLLALLCLVLLSQAAAAAVPTWAVMPPTAGTTCTKIVDASPSPEDASLSIAVGLSRGEGDYYSYLSIFDCDAGLMESLPINDFRGNANGSTTNSSGDSLGIRSSAGQYYWVTGRVLDCTSNDWKQNAVEAGNAVDIKWGVTAQQDQEAPGDAADIRWGIAGHSKVTDNNDYVKFDRVDTGTSTCNSTGSLKLASTSWKQNPQKEASCGMAAIKGASCPTTITSQLFPISNYPNCTPVSASVANAATSTTTVSPAPHQRYNLRRLLCSLPLTRETMTLSNRKWRLLETS